mgnify:CR=1 FL=1
MGPRTFLCTRRRRCDDVRPRVCSFRVASFACFVVQLLQANVACCSVICLVGVSCVAGFIHARAAAHRAMVLVVAALYGLSLLVVMSWYVVCICLWCAPWHVKSSRGFVLSFIVRVFFFCPMCMLSGDRKPWLAAVAVGLGACTAMLPRDIAVQLGAAANVGGIMGFVISGGGMGIAALALVGSGVTRLYPVHSHGGFRA